MTHLLLTVRFLDDRYHGLLDRGGSREWPPSPFRLFQALVAGVARRGELVVGDDVESNTTFTEVGKALIWLQRLTRDHPPIIIAPKSQPGQAIKRFVPNNDGDKKFDRQGRLTAKPTIPTLFLLEPDQKPEVHYVWDVSRCHHVPENYIRDAARSLTALGWGVDMAFADAKLADEKALRALKGERWHPKKNMWRDEGMLRAPTCDDNTKECTLCDLRHCHHSAISRIEHGKPLKTVDKPKVFDRVLYASTERPIGLPYAVFKMLDDNDKAVPHAKLIHVAGMVRCAAIKAMKNNPPDVPDPEKWVEVVVAGHRDPSYSPYEPFAYVPLPSIGHPHADARIRRVMIVAPMSQEAHLHHLSEQLNGVRLTPEGAAATTSRPILEEIRPDKVAKCYLATADTWQTVTPVLLHGHDDHKPEKTVKLIQRTLRESGVETSCEFTWQSTPFFRHALSAHKHDSQGRRTGYFRPPHLDGYTAVHLRLRFGRREVMGDPESPWTPSRVAGPLVIGAGRYCGFGLLAASQS